MFLVGFPGFIVKPLSVIVSRYRGEILLSVKIGPVECINDCNESIQTARGENTNSIKLTDLFQYGC